MPKKSRLVALLAILWLVATAGEASSVELNLRGLRGNGVSSADVAEGNTILVVWASWSPRCRDIVERLQALKASWGSNTKLYAVSFNEDAADVERFLSGKNLSVPVVLDTDGAFSKKHAITVLPGLIVVQSGQVTYAGKLPDSPEALLSGLLQ